MTNQSALILKMALMLLLLHSTDAKMDIITKTLDVVVGGEIFLLCKVGGEGDITWKKDGEEIDDEDKVSEVDESSSKLIIQNVSMQDAGRYTCLCEFNTGHNDDVTKQIYVYGGPSFGSTVTYHEFLEGTDGVVPCLVTGQPAVDVHWLRNKEQISSNAGQHVHHRPDNTVLIEKVRREDAGTYLCEAIIRGRPIHKELPITVVNAPPTAHLRQEVKKVMAGPETNVSLLCLVSGHPKPNITWITPVTADPSRHHFNSDRSQLIIRSVARADYGEYICTAANKIAENSDTYILHVNEAPEVFVSAEQQSVLVGERVSVSCNVSGHPQPELHWLNKHNGRTLDSSSGLVRVVDGALVIDEVAPSDGGLYSCMAVSTSGNASRDVAIHTQPGPPQYLSVSSGPTSVVFSLKMPPVSGGTPITSFVLQYKRSAAEEWKEVTVPASGDKSPPLDAKMDILIKTLDVVVGGEIFLLCKAGGEGEIKWKKDGEEIDDEDKVSKVDESSSKLIIKNASMQDAGRYTCLCEFENGHNDDVTKQIYVYEGPSFGSTVTYHEFLEGTDGVVPYLVTGQPAVDVHWLRNKEQISSNGQHVHQRPDNTVLIEKVRRDDAGTYLCEAIIRGRPIHKELPITVVVNAPPTAHLRAEVKKVMAGPETNVSLLCLVSGHPKPNITWITPVTADPSRHHFNSDRSQLTIRSVARADYGEYICTAANKIAENNDTYMLHVNAKASSMTTGRVVGIVMVILLMVFLVVVIITFQTFLCVAAEK